MNKKHINKKNQQIIKNNAVQTNVIESEMKKEDPPIMTKTDLVKTVVGGVVWGLCYLFIRRYLNPDIRDEYAKFTNDAIYGGIAFTIAYIIKIIVEKYISSLKLDEN